MKQILLDADFCTMNPEVIHTPSQHRNIISGLLEIIKEAPEWVGLTTGQTNFQDIIDFHQRFMVPCSPVPAFLDQPAFEYRTKFLQEELNEIVTDYHKHDLAGVADGLVDLVYVALGTALMMGLPWQSLWTNVHTQNMLKRLAKPDGSDSKRNNPLDVIKPEGWAPPDHTHILGVPESGQSFVHIMVMFDATAAVLDLAERRKKETAE
jgi:predicted HAD superfamily Cof-like phosphohydrolase